MQHCRGYCLEFEGITKCHKKFYRNGIVYCVGCDIGFLLTKAANTTESKNQKCCPCCGCNIRHGKTKNRNGHKYKDLQN